MFIHIKMAKLKDTQTKERKQFKENVTKTRLSHLALIRQKRWPTKPADRASSVLTEKSSNMPNKGIMSPPISSTASKQGSAKGRPKLFFCVFSFKQPGSYITKF